MLTKFKMSQTHFSYYTFFTFNLLKIKELEEKINK